jgi:hypothetical protein
MPGRKTAIKNDPRTNQVAFGEIMGKKGGAVADVSKYWFKPGFPNLGQASTKTKKLFVGKGMFRIIGQGQMGKDPFHKKTLEGREFPQDDRKLLGTEADSSHAGIDLQVKGANLVRLMGKTVKAARYIKIEKRRCKGVTENVIFLAGIDPTKHHYRTCDPCQT